VARFFLAHSVDVDYDIMLHCYTETAPEQVLVLFRAETSLLRCGLGTFFVPAPDDVKHFR